MLDKYSDRPILTMITLSNWSTAFGFLQYGEPLRRLRKLVHGTFATRARVDLFNPILKSANVKFLGLLLDDPNNFMEHVRLFVIYFHLLHFVYKLLTSYIVLSGLLSFKVHMVIGPK